MKLKMDKKIASYLGLMKKAGLISSGELSAIDAITNQKAKLVIIAEDASPNTVKKFSNKCHYYNVPLIRYGQMFELGHCLGQSERSSVCILDDKFAKVLKSRLDEIMM